MAKAMLGTAGKDTDFGRDLIASAKEALAHRGDLWVARRRYGCALYSRGGSKARVSTCHEIDGACY